MPSLVVSAAGGLNRIIYSLVSLPTHQSTFFVILFQSKLQTLGTPPSYFSIGYFSLLSSGLAYSFGFVKWHAHSTDCLHLKCTFPKFDECLIKPQ